MPEHAEVRVAASQLTTVISGRTLESIAFSHQRTTRHAVVEDFDRFVGARIVGARSIGKWIFIEAASHDDRLGVHLRMSGQLLVATPGQPHPDRHVHAVLALSNRASTPVHDDAVPAPPGGAIGVGSDPVEVWFRDPRTFGEWRVVPSGVELGAPELFDRRITTTWAVAAAERRSIGIKALLLDQQAVVAGVGSYLADEALHRAGVHPLVPANTITESQWESILAAARSVATESAARGGVTLADEGWVDLWGRPGTMGEVLAVHARASCRRCGAATESAPVSGRRARWCPACQRSD